MPVAQDMSLAREQIVSRLIGRVNRQAADGRHVNFAGCPGRERYDPLEPSKRGSLDGSWRRARRKGRRKWQRWRRASFARYTRREIWNEYFLGKIRRLQCCCARMERRRNEYSIDAEGLRAVNSLTTSISRNKSQWCKNEWYVNTRGDIQAYN